MKIYTLKLTQILKNTTHCSLQNQIKFKFYLNVTFPSILIISYIKTVSLPADPSRFGFFNRVHQRPHPVGVCRVGLHQVDYIEAVCMVLPSVLDFEIVPLSESTSAIIIFEIQIILEVATIINFSQWVTYTLTALLRFPLSNLLSNIRVLSCPVCSRPLSSLQ